MKFNRSLFWRIFLTLCLIESCLFLAGCTAAWLTAISGMLPSIAAVANAILAFAASLQNKTVSAATYAALQKWQANVASAITAAQAIIASYKANANAGTLAQFQAAMQAVLQQFNSILTAVDVTDSATVAKFTQFVGLGIAALNAVLALVPLAIQKVESKASAEELKQYDKLGASAIAGAEKLLKDNYVAIVTEKTANADVNTALAALPRTI